MTRGCPTDDGAPRHSRPSRFWVRAIPALTPHVLRTVPWATLLAGCSIGTVLLALLAQTSHTPLDQDTVRLCLLPAVAALAFVPRPPSQALAGTTPVPGWVPPAVQTLLAVPVIAVTCWAQLMIMASTVPPGAGHQPATYPLVAQFTGWSTLGVAAAAVCSRSPYADLGGAIAAPVAVVTIAMAWVTPSVKDVLAVPPATPETAVIAWCSLATGALAVAAAGMRDRWHRYTRPRLRRRSADRPNHSWSE